MLASVQLTPVLAHFGHWYFQLLYAVPVTVIVGVLTLQSWRDGRARKARERAKRTTSAAGASEAAQTSGPPPSVLH
jgi:hypothetical protein